MSNWRTFRRDSGRLGRSSVIDFWQLSRTVQDPSIPNLPLETPESGPTIVSAGFAITGAGVITLNGAAIAASHAAITTAAVFAPVSMATAAARLDLQGTAVLTFQGDAVTSGTIAAAEFQITAAGAFEATGAALNASTFDLSAVAELVFEGAAESGVIASAAFGIDTQAALTFEGEAVPDNTVVTLGADQWRIRKEDQDEEAEIMALMEQIIPMAVAHRTGLQVRR